MGRYFCFNVSINVSSDDRVNNKYLLRSTIINNFNSNINSVINHNDIELIDLFSLYLYLRQKNPEWNYYIKQKFAPTFVFSCHSPLLHSKYYIIPIYQVSVNVYSGPLYFTSIIKDPSIVHINKYRFHYPIKRGSDDGNLYINNITKHSIHKKELNDET